jgi:ATP-binding cassette subfamily F protein uup
MQRSRGTLVARNITKSYGDTVVLERLSLTVNPSSRIGVVGPNGIGKSTLLRLLAGVEEPDSGAITRDPPDLTVAYLAQELAAAGLSGGEAARARLEAILAADAEMLLLDEPTNDLDFAALELVDRFVERFRGGLVSSRTTAPSSSE